MDRIAHLRTRLAVAMLAALAAGGCGGIATNRTLASVHQPVVERQSYAIDLQVGSGSLASGERQRLAGWLADLGPRYGDRVDVAGAAPGDGASDDVAAEIARAGLSLRPTLGVGIAPVPNTVRVTVSRAFARVPGCPDWSAGSDFNPNNATSSNYGCAVGANLAAMVADPEHLLHGESGSGGDDAGRWAEIGTGRSRKAIDSYRDAEPTGGKGLKQQATTGGSER